LQPEGQLRLWECQTVHLQLLLLPPCCQVHRCQPLRQVLKLPLLLSLQLLQQQR
jgi:hypothetical protein